MKQLFIIILSFVFVSCKYLKQIDRKEELDFKYPSILSHPLPSFDKVKEKIVGIWIGNKSLLKGDTTKETYQVEIKFITEESFSILERKINDNESLNKISTNADLFIIDDYVFEVGYKQIGIIQINYLSDKQLKLGDLLFEKHK